MTTPTLTPLPIPNTQPTAVKQINPQLLAAMNPNDPQFASSLPSLPAPQLQKVGAPPPTPLQQNIAADQGQLQKLRVKDANPYGTVNNHPGVLGKVLHSLSVAGNIAGDIFAPTVMANVPGTDLNREVQESGLVHRLNGEQDQQSQEDERTAQTQNLNMQPELNQEKQALAQEKQDEVDDKDTNTHALQLAKQGQVEITGADGQKHIVDDPGSQVYQTRKALTDYHGAQTALDQARTELAQAGNNPKSPAYQLALAKLHVAQQNASAAGERAQAYMMNAQVGNFGTYNGQAVPGAMIDGNGNPVGERFSTNVRPTGQERTRHDMAVSAQEQLTDIQQIMQKHPGMFGPGYGQSSAFKQWLGSEDPDAQRFQAARTIAADHLAGTFGGRSEAALSALDKAIGEYKDNPKAAVAGIDQLLKANQVFQKAGSMRTVGGNTQPQANRGLSVGTVKQYNGASYKFKGGDQYDQKNWVKQ